MEFILLENRKTQQKEKCCHFFSGPYDRICCNSLAKVTTCLDQLQAMQKNGKYLVGYLSYEVAYALDPSILPSYHYTSNRPLLDFYAFDNHQLLTPLDVDKLLNEISSPAGDLEDFIYDFKFNLNKSTYDQKFKKIKNYLQEGETYQVNLTGVYDFLWQGSELNLYKRLREKQRVEFAAYFHLNQFKLLSLSPELFFEKKDDLLRSQPVKGTLASSNSGGDDKLLIKNFKKDPKILSENLIIVDLIRNDLSIIAKQNTVKAPQLFEIETYETFHQMKSTVECKVDKGLSFRKIISSIFPCGSITGAPKRNTMRIIRELENADRGIYTGAIGYITPSNDMCFNVAIRTLLLQNNKGEMGVGGGIIHDSINDVEFDEVKVKAQFVAELAVGFDLIECFLYEQGYIRLASHLTRLENSAHFFNFIFDKKIIMAKLMILSHHLSCTKKYKIKITLTKRGDIDIIYNEVNPSINSKRSKIKVSNTMVETAKNILFNHKTTASSVRTFYNQELQRVVCSEPVFDVVFFNEHGFLTEGTKTSIFIEKNKQLLTPKLSCGLLPGIMRRQILDNFKNSQKSFINKQQFLSADKIWVTNSVIGMLEVDLLL